MTSEIQHLLKEAAVDGDTIPLSLDHIMRAGLRRRRGTSALIASCVVGTVAVVAAGAVLLSGQGRVVGQVGGTAPVVGGQPDVTISSTGAITAIFHDPEATASTLNQVFRDRGLNIQVQLGASSPSGVGRLLTLERFDGGSGRSLSMVNSESPCGGTQACTIGITVPADYSGSSRLVIGRAARPDEDYTSAADATTQGEALACSNIIGATVAQAQVILVKRGLTADQWRGLGNVDLNLATSGDLVVNNAVSSRLGHVLLEAEPASEFAKYPAKNQPCYPTAVARAG